MFRTVLERKHPDVRAYADELLERIVDHMQAACRIAFRGRDTVTPMEKALAAIVPDTCITSCGLTRDYVSDRHVDDTDMCEGAFTSCVAWFAEGDLFQHGHMVTWSCV